jgi:arylsulfatase A-like enzyme
MRANTVVLMCKRYVMGTSRREFLKTGGAGFAMGLVEPLLSRAGIAEDEAMRPNILYLHTHDMGRYCQPYGYAVPTPNMQRLAEEGVLFHKAFTAGPTCSPGRASLLTGQSPHSCGMLGLAHRGHRLYDYGHHIVHTLRKAGYYSALIGTQHIAPYNEREIIGYDEIVDVGAAEADESAKSGDEKLLWEARIAAAARQWLSDAPKQPFFVSVGFNVTHRIFTEPGPEEDARYCRPPDPIPNTPETRRDMAAYRASARVLDTNYGVVLDALKSAGLEKNTLVICTTEHGIAFPSMKCNLTDHGMGVALLMRGPGGFTGGRVVDAMVSQIDVFPTLCEMLDIGKPGWLEGKSFMPVIEGRAEEVNEEVFSEVTYHAAYEPMRCVRTKRWKYIRRFDGRTRPVLPNCDAGPSKSVWLESGWKDRAVAAEQLYDLVFDPVEVNNLAGGDSAEIKEVLGDMRARLERWMRATDDPLLKGDVNPPPGAVWRTTDPDEVSPGGKFYNLRG